MQCQGPAKWEEVTLSRAKMSVSIQAKYTSVLLLTSLDNDALPRHDAHMESNSRSATSEIASEGSFLYS